MKKTADEEIRRMLEKDSPKATLASFGIALIYGAVAAVAGMAGREMIEGVAAKAIYGMKLQVNQYGGYYKTAAIAGAAAMVLAWLGTFLWVWHAAGRGETVRERVRIGLLWTLGAAAAYLLFAVIELAAVGVWPLAG